MTPNGLAGCFIGGGDRGKFPGAKRIGDTTIRFAVVGCDCCADTQDVIEVRISLQKLAMRIDRTRDKTRWKPNAAGFLYISSRLASTTK
jgi:hypothetical protein